MLLNNSTTQLSLLATYFALMLPMYMYPPSQFFALALIALFVPLLTRRLLGYWIILEVVIAMQTLIVVFTYDIFVFAETISYLAPIIGLSASLVSDGTLLGYFSANPLASFFILAGIGMSYLFIVRPSIWLAKSILDARRRVNVYLGNHN